MLVSETQKVKQAKLSYQLELWLDLLILVYVFIICFINYNTLIFFYFSFIILYFIILIQYWFFFFGSIYASLCIVFLLKEIDIHIDNCIILNKYNPVMNKCIYFSLFCVDDFAIVQRFNFNILNQVTQCILKFKVKIANVPHIEWTNN